MKPGFIAKVALMPVCAAALASIASAQESVNQGSISGRVTDPQGAVVPGAQIVVRHIGNECRRRDRHRCRRTFPISVSATRSVRESRVRMPGFADATRRLTLTMGSAFELPVTLTVAGLDTQRDGDGARDGARGRAQSDRRDGVAG